MFDNACEITVLTFATAPPDKPQFKFKITLLAGSISEITSEKIV